MPTPTPHRGSWDWNGHPVQLGYAFRVHRRRGDRVLEAGCSLQSYVFGWELVLTVNRLLSGSRVCRTLDELLDISEDWRAATVSVGWQ